MLRTTGLLALVVAVLLLTGFDKTWSAFTKKDANFTVMLPGTPKEETATEETAVGPISLYQASVITTSKAYFVSYSDLPKATWKGDTKKMLEGARDGAAGRVGGKVVADRTIKLGGKYPGREFTVVVADKLELTQRVWLVKHRLYQVNMGCPIKGCTKAEVKDYLDSFKLLAAPPK
jgi:hypothetical protein